LRGWRSGSCAKACFILGMFRHDGVGGASTFLDLLEVGRKHVSRLLIACEMRSGDGNAMHDSDIVIVRDTCEVL
jgi:hypothetical protein